MHGIVLFWSAGAGEIDSKLRPKLALAGPAANKQIAKQGGIIAAARCRAIVSALLSNSFNLQRKALDLRRFTVYQAGKTRTDMLLP